MGHHDALREGLTEVQDAPISTWASAGLSQRAGPIAARSARALDFLRELLEVVPDVQLLVLAEDDWAGRSTTTVEVIQEFAHVRARRRSRADAAHIAPLYLHAFTSWSRRPTISTGDSPCSRSIRHWEHSTPCWRRWRLAEKRRRSSQRIARSHRSPACDGWIPKHRP